jgi:predicted ferric reductase
MLFSYALLGLLWFHAPLTSRFNLIGLIVVSATLALQKVIWFALILFRNRSFQATNIATKEGKDLNDTTKDALCRLVISLERPWKYEPGQYVYIRIPRLGSRRSYGRIESHPFQIAWYENDNEGFVRRIHILVEARRGFSRRLDSHLDTELPSTSIHDLEPLAKPDIRVQLEGPYGNVHVVDYDKIILISNGIGVVSHLAIVKYLLALGARTRTRRIDLIWYSQGKSWHVRLARPLLANTA